ncbi:MAG: NrfD/PsrC family molybdoenzyme membrane anchor subunit [Syntrophobacteraceae bacterium]
MKAHAHPAALRAPFWTPGVLVMVAFITTAFFFIIARYTGGLRAVTHLSDAYPWGLWIGIDVATGVALAAGGFTSAALAHVFGRHAYESVTRPALLTAVLGYTFVSLALLVDIGRSWTIWHPLVYRQGNSVLFEVAMCVVIYLHVLYIEFIPIVAEQYKGRVQLPGPLSVLNRPVDALITVADRILDKVMWVFILAGVVLSCMHQSGLGSLLLIAPTKVHPLWYTPILPLLFLLSAIAVGFPMIIVENGLAAASFRLQDESGVLSKLSRFTIVLLGIYMLMKLGDIVVRGAHVYLFDGSVQSRAFIVEMLVGVIAPWCMLLSERVRGSRRALFIASALIVGGVALNRVNVFVVSFTPPYAETSYFPSIGEIAITAGFIAALMLTYRILVTYLPILSPKSREVASA